MTKTNLPREKLISTIACFSTEEIGFKSLLWEKDGVRDDVTILPDLVDLWVIRLKKPMILCACRASSSGEESCSESMRKVCLFYNQNIKILWLSNMGETFLEKVRRCAKVCGPFFLIVIFGCWLAEQENSDHVDNYSLCHARVILYKPVEIKEIVNFSQSMLVAVVN